MDRNYYINLARSGLRMPIGADLVLREKPDAEAILHDGRRLGMVIEEAARRYRTPLAIPHMDLEVEKASLLLAMGVPPGEVRTHRLAGCPDKSTVALAKERLEGPPDPRLRAQIDAVAYVSSVPDLLPMGMAIGPFSLMTKLLADPITPIYLAGSGVTAEDDEDVRAVEVALELATVTILRSVRLQARAGAKAVVIAEPAANQVYLSPRQMEQGSDVFERYVMQHNGRIKQALEEEGVDLMFHCCGELTDEMVRSFCTLRPVILSLGSSRRLWEDAAIVPKDVVLYGNLPTKRFYSDDLVTDAEVRRMAAELTARMRDAGHPFILGSECDVLSVPGCEQTIKAKVAAFMEA
jgi:uroporphyrinogen-III decarboxylase